MAAHAPAEVEGDSALARHFRRLQFFPTPPWAARAGGELIASLDPGDWTAWEPACGQGHLAHGLKDYFRTVATSDIFDHAWDGQDRVADFMARDDGRNPEVDWIATNPPFTLAAEFVRLGLQRARRGVALLCRASWYESAGRYSLFFGETPLTAYAPFFERVPMVLGRWDPSASTATAYAWFVFMRPELTPPPIAALRDALGPCAVTRAIPPGTKRRLTLADDARRFGLAAEPMTLFGDQDG